MRKFVLAFRILATLLTASRTAGKKHSLKSALGTERASRHEFAVASSEDPRRGFFSAAAFAVSPSLSHLRAHLHLFLFPGDRNSRCNLQISRRTYFLQFASPIAIPRCFSHPDGTQSPPYPLLRVPTCFSHNFFRDQVASSRWMTDRRRRKKGYKRAALCLEKKISIGLKIIRDVAILEYHACAWCVHQTALYRVCCAVNVTVRTLK